MLAVSFDARKALVLDGSVAGYRALHFATHALLNERHPEQPADWAGFAFEGTGRCRPRPVRPDRCRMC